MPRAMQVDNQRVDQYISLGELAERHRKIIALHRALAGQRYPVKRTLGRGVRERAP